MSQRVSSDTCSWKGLLEITRSWKIRAKIKKIIIVSMQHWKLSNFDCYFPTKMEIFSLQSFQFSFFSNCPFQLHEARCCWLYDVDSLRSVLAESSFWRLLNFGKSVTHISNRPPRPQTFHQYKLSPTSSTDIDVAATMIELVSSIDIGDTQREIGPSPEIGGNVPDEQKMSENSWKGPGELPPISGDGFIYIVDKTVDCHQKQ